MTSSKCKVCSHPLFEESLLSYKNMPSVAQHLPDAESLHKDAGEDLHIFMCSGCGLVQLDIEPVPYYKEVIRAVAYSPSMKEFREKQFKNFVEEYNLKGKKVIEIGAGKGEYLQIMKDAGVEAYGIEHAEESVKAGVKAGLSVTQGFIENPDYQIPGGLFDAFFIISFFEHLPKPGDVLRGIHKNLVSEGIGIVEVPNFDMMLRDNLFSEFMRDHLFYFTKRTLTTTLEMNGFEVLDVQEIWQNYILSATVKKRGVTNLSAFSDSQAKIKKELDDFIGRYNRVAIWGAGHQAFAIMAMADLGTKIKYVLDSAPFKQGKFTPASHIPIVPPDTLITDPVNAIIIMAGSYSDEIKKIIAEKYNSDIKIAILREHSLEHT